MRRLPCCLAAALALAACAPEPVKQVAAPDVVIPTASAPPSTAPPPPDATESAPAPNKAQRRLAFKLESVNGAGTAHIAADKVHVIHVWASFCAPCKLSLPALQKLADQYGGSGLQVLAIAEDEEEDSVKSFVANLKLTFPVALDAGSVVANTFKPGRIPCTFVLDRSGSVRFVQEGYKPGDEVELEEKIKSML